ncbi:MAG: hypothetical protein HQ532_01835, partial [Candidatus Omnitrophica bacterium]|nr:hypothetical protein [Candidatus Omnitrophota bacterium]
VEALEEKDLSFISEDKSNPVVLLGKQAIEKGEIVSVPFMGGSATTVKREIGQHKMVHKALKVRIKKAGRLVTGWISIAQARLGLIFGQNTNSKVVVVTSVDGTKEGESDKSVRDLLDTEYSEARNSGQINVSVQKAGLVLDTKTGLPLMFKDRHIATCAENHLWAFLSILMDKALVIDLLENSSGILSAGNGDNILNYPRASMVGEILKARKDGESIATVAMCSPSKGDKKGGFAARVTYRNKETGEEITQIEFREVSEFATRKKGDKAKKIPGTGYEAIDFFGEEDTDIFKRLDKEKQFIEDIFGDRSVAFNVAFYAVDLRLFIARIFGFDETKSDLIARLKGVDSQYWVDRIIELSEKVPETIQPEKKVPNEDNTDNVKGYITEQAVQDFIVNSMGLLAKDGISPAVDIKLGDRKDTFLPYKGKKQSVLREDGSEVMGDDGRPREDYDLIANIAVYKSAIGSLKEKGHPLVLGEGAHVAEVLSTTKDEIIKVNIASGHKLGTSDKQQLKIYVIPADKLERNPVPFNNWLDRQNKATTKVIIIARDRDEFDKQLVNYKNKYKDTGKVLLKIIEKPGVDISSMEEEFILRGVVPEDLTYAIGVFGKDAFFGGFELKVLNTDKDKALFKAIGEGV